MRVTSNNLHIFCTHTQNNHLHPKDKFLANKFRVNVSYKLKPTCAHYRYHMCNFSIYSKQVEENFFSFFFVLYPN